MKISFPQNFYFGASQNGLMIDWKDEDFTLIKKLGLRMISVSLDWEKLEPEEGKFTLEYFDAFCKSIRKLKHLGVIPIVSLFSRKTPLWFSQKGGFGTQNNNQSFYRYVEWVMEKLYREVFYWVILHAPERYIGECLKSQTDRKFFFERRDEKSVRENLIHIQRTCYERLHKNFCGISLGITKDFSHITLSSSDKIKEKFLKRYQYEKNRQFLDETDGSFDFLGVNYFWGKRLTLRYKEKSFTDFASSDLLSVKENIDGKYREVQYKVSIEDTKRVYSPKDLYLILRDCKDFHTPIIITENGIGRMKDYERRKFIRDHLASIHRAKSDFDLSVCGYLYWPLFGCLNQDKESRGHRGLILIDRRTKHQYRTVQDSAMWYAGIAKKHSFEFSEKKVRPKVYCSM